MAPLLLFIACMSRSVQFDERRMKHGRMRAAQARYIRAWVPELAELPPELAHQPWRAPSSEPRGYPPPLLPPETQVARGPRRDGQS